MTLNSIVANFQTFKLVDLLDILIIAFLKIGRAHV